MNQSERLEALLQQVRGCTLCAGSIPEPCPVLRAHVNARVLIVGQAPGTRVHRSGIPWDDPSGERLRRWMGVGAAQFYDESQVAIIPMGFCYPGKGRSGDLPPPPICAQTWHQRLLELLPDIECTLLIGQYAQKHYCEDEHQTLTARVMDWQRLAPERFILPHPSPRNQLWLRRNPWFERELVPQLQMRIKRILGD